MSIVAPGAKDLENRAQVDSLETLQYDRRQLLQKRLLPLRVEYGSFGTIDAKRKQYVEALKAEHWDTLQAKLGKAPAEWMVDAAAYGDKRYQTFIDKWEIGRTEWIMAENDLTEIEEKIRSREIELRAYSAETMLGR